MPRPVDLGRIRTKARKDLGRALGHYNSVQNLTKTVQLDYLLVRWIAMMTLVEIHAVWERYVEERLVASLNHSPAHFLKENGIRGASRIPLGLASYAVRSGRRYFDFRSMSDLIPHGDRLLGQSANPFRSIAEDDRKYLDALSAIRNRIVHRSDASFEAYKRSLRNVYGIRSAPEPDEFLNAIDYRTSSPARRKSRLHGLAKIVERTIQHI